MNGLTITLCFGKYGGFHIYVNSEAGRICLGWVAVTIYWRTDLEEMFKHLVECRKELIKLTKNNYE